MASMGLKWGTKPKAARLATARAHSTARSTSSRAWRDGGWRDILGLTVFGFLCILLVVGPLLDTSTFFMAGFSASSPLAVYLAGVPVNCVHGSAVARTMLLFGKPLLDRLRRIQIKYGMMEP